MSQFVALCLTAGLTTAEALERAAEQVDAPLGPQLQQVTRSVRAGNRWNPALSSVTRLLAVPELDRLTDTLLTGARHGCRWRRRCAIRWTTRATGDGRQRWNGQGRAEIAMLVPVVFLILPAVVAVAVYRGLSRSHPCEATEGEMTDGGSGGDGWGTTGEMSPAGSWWP